MLPFTVPSAPSAPSRSTSVEKLCSGPNRSSATAVEKSFIVDAGCIISPAFCAKSVSPRVSEVIITPNFPLRTRVAIIPARSLWRAAAPRSEVQAVEAAGAATRPRVVRREVRLTGFFVRERERLDDCATAASGTGACPAISASSPEVASRAPTTHVMTATRAGRARRVKLRIPKMEVASRVPSAESRCRIGAKRPEGRRAIQRWVNEQALRASHLEDDSAPMQQVEHTIPQEHKGYGECE